MAYPLVLSSYTILYIVYCVLYIGALIHVIDLQCFKIQTTINGI